MRSLRNVSLYVPRRFAEYKLQIPLNYIVNSEIQFCRSFDMPTKEFPAMLQMMEKGRLQPGRLVTKRISLEEIGSAFEEMTNFSGIGVTVVTEF